MVVLFNYYAGIHTTAHFNPPGHRETYQARSNVSGVRKLF